jgi:hypothetical protein
VDDRERDHVRDLEQTVSSAPTTTTRIPDSTFYALTVEGIAAFNDLNDPIHSGQDLRARCSKRQGIRYPISATYKNREIGRFWLRLI